MEGVLTWANSNDSGLEQYSPDPVLSYIGLLAKSIIDVRDESSASDRFKTSKFSSVNIPGLSEAYASEISELDDCHSELEADEHRSVKLIYSFINCWA